MRVWKHGGKLLGGGESPWRKQDFLPLPGASWSCRSGKKFWRAQESFESRERWWQRGRAVAYREELGLHPWERHQSWGKEKTFSEGPGEGWLSSEMLKITAGLRAKCLSATGTQRAGTGKNAMASNRLASLWISSVQNIATSHYLLLKALQIQILTEFWGFSPQEGRVGSGYWLMPPKGNIKYSRTIIHVLSSSKATSSLLGFAAWKSEKQTQKHFERQKTLKDVRAETSVFLSKI